MDRDQLDESLQEDAFLQDKADRKGNTAKIEPVFVRSKLAETASCLLYLGRHRMFDTDVVVKLLRPEFAKDSARRDRFQHKVRNVVRLRNGDALGVFELRQLDDGTPYVVREYVAAETLTQFLKSRTRVTEDVARTLLHTIASALSSLHDEGLVHGELRPDHMLVANERRVRFTDLGLGVSSQPDGSGSVDQLEGLRYTAPELVAAAPSPAADVHALGSILYFMLTGSHAFLGQDRGELVNTLRCSDFPTVPGIANDLAEVLARCTHRDPDRRYPDARAVLEALRSPAAVTVGGAAENPAPAIIGQAQATSPSPATANATAAGSTVPMPALTWADAAPDAKLVSVDGVQLPSIVVDKRLGIRMVLIPRGSFTMGSPHHEIERARTYSEDEHVRTIRKAFWLGETEVTQAQWKKLMPEKKPRALLRALKPGEEAPAPEPRDLRPVGDEHPISDVSWDECKQFLAKLNEGGGTFRLPSEAEWEYACRARTSTAFSCGPRLYPEQHCFDATRRYGDGPTGAKPTGTVPVRSLPPNALGLYEMHGNVAEWCEDVIDKYPSSGNEEPKLGDGERVHRGGSWNCPMRNCRSAARESMPASASDSKVGFRVARSL